MDITYIDINCDVGEGMGNEAMLFPFISSCSIACGGHTGGESTMLETVQLAKKYEVKVGAHPSYPDRENFGRLSLDITEERLIKTIREQIEGLVAILEKEKMDLHHIKPHGALYNDVSKDVRLAQILLKSLKKYKHHVQIYAPYGSVLASEVKKHDFSIKYEAFGDRGYRKDLSLVPRNNPNALIQNPQDVLKQVLSIIKEHKIRSSDGSSVRIFADTICIHGDTPSVLQIVSYLSQRLPIHNIQIKK